MDKDHTHLERLIVFGVYLLFTQAIVNTPITFDGRVSQIIALVLMAVFFMVFLIECGKP